MTSMLRWKILAILVVVVVVGGLPFLPSKRIKLGLDLKGGIYLLCRVVTDDAVVADLANTELRVSQALEEKKIQVQAIRPVKDTQKDIFELQFSGVPQDKLAEFEELLGKWGDFKLERRGSDADWALVEGPERKSYIRAEAVEQTLRTIKNRIDKLGVSEPIVQRQGMEGDRILVQLPGVDDPERVKELISAVGSLDLKLVEDGPFKTRQEALGRYGGSEDGLPPRLQLVSGTEKDEYGVVYTLWYVVDRLATVTGGDITHASPDRDDYGQPSVQFSLGAQGSKRFAEVTGRNVGRRLAIILENKVESAPVIRDRISSSGQISGLESDQEMRDLVIVLNAGAHPAGLQYLQESTIGPWLDQDSVRSGLLAGVVGLVAVVFFMLIYYKWSGLNAVVALVLNVVLIVGVMAFLGSVLTMPGVAGLILTIGMAVDANVLVFERIREELRAGKTVKSAIEGGFAKAFMTILDSNLTTIISAVVLFIYGTGPIRGFGVTLTFGLLANMFTGVFVSKTIFEASVLSRQGKVERLSI